METKVVVQTQELLEAADIDGIKAFYDDLRARIGAGKIFPMLSEDAAKQQKKLSAEQGWTLCFVSAAPGT